MDLSTTVGADIWTEWLTVVLRNRSATALSLDAIINAWTPIATALQSTKVTTAEVTA
jgi:hypothetical protein